MQTSHGRWEKSNGRKDSVRNKRIGYSFGSVEVRAREKARRWTSWEPLKWWEKRKQNPSRYLSG